jgi:hypothetical protein
MANKKDAVDTSVEDAPDAWKGVSPEYQNYADITGKPLAAPGEDDDVVIPSPEGLVTVNPDGSVAGKPAEVADEDTDTADESTDDDEPAANDSTTTPPPVPQP